VIKKEEQNYAIAKTLFYLLNIAVLYNAIVWGQVDIVSTCFVFISCYMAFYARITLSLLFLVLALNYKLQCIIFLPVVGLVLLPSLILNFSVKKLAQWTLVPVAIQVLILVPYLLEGSTDQIWQVITAAFGVFPMISANAYNAWYLLLPGTNMQSSDLVEFAGITYKRWGLIMFFISSAIALFPFMLSLYQSLKTKQLVQIPPERAFIIFSLVPLLFFYFNTEMHERYSHPALPFLITFCILKRSYLLLAVASGAYLLNLEGVFKFLQLPNYETLIFDPRFVSALWLLSILTLYFYLYTFKTAKFVTRINE
jgi:hypothetical protein